MFKMPSVPVVFKLAILLVLVLAVLLSVAFVANAPLASAGHQVAQAPILDSSSGYVAPSGLRSIQPLANWDS